MGKEHKASIDGDQWARCLDDNRTETGGGAGLTTATPECGQNRTQASPANADRVFGSAGQFFI